VNRSDFGELFPPFVHLSPDGEYIEDRPREGLKVMASTPQALIRSVQTGCPKEVPLNWSRWFRQLHRWLSIAFTLVVIFNGVAVLKHRYTNWMGLLAVAALALMFFTGMYLFVLPYVSKWRSGRRAD
jgi:hypothetical protein